MATGFGTNANIGLAEEVTFNTYVTPDNWYEITEESMALKQSWISVPTLRSASQNQRVRSKLSVEGGFKFNMGFNGLKRILRNAMGSVGTSGAGPYTNTYSLANTLPGTVCLQVNRDGSAIGQAFRYTGCQISKVTISQEIEALAMCDVEIVGTGSATNATITAATFPTPEQMDWEMFSVDINSVTQTQIKSFEFTIENAIADDRFTLGDRSRIGLGRSGPRKISGKWTQEFATLTEYNLFSTLAVPFPIVASWLNDATGKSLTATIRAVLTSADVSVSDAGVIMAEFEFEAYQNTTSNDELSIVVVSTQNL